MTLLLTVTRFECIAASAEAVSGSSSVGSLELDNLVGDDSE